MSTQTLRKGTGVALCILIGLTVVVVGSRVGSDVRKAKILVRPPEARSFGPGGVPAGEPAPVFALKDLDGNEINLADQRGKVVLVNFWATWCPPCLKELPHIQRFHEQYRDKGLVVLAISTDRAKEKVRPFVEKHAYTFPVLFADEKVASAYKVRGIPVVYLIDREGAVQVHQVGYSPGGEKRIEQQVKKLLENHTGHPL